MALILKKPFLLNCLIGIVLTGAALLLTIPSFLKETTVGHDLLYHLNWAECFQTQFFEGDFYPRWLFEMKGGRGSPVFYYYGPLPYYVSTLFAAVLPETNNILVSLGATYCFALLASSIGVYWFFRLSKSHGSAFLFTLLYMLYPYHLVADLYIRFAFGEFFAIAWVPFLFIAIKKLAENCKTAMPFLAIFYALLILSHIPTTLLVTPVLLLYFIILSERKTTIYRVLLAFILGIGMAAFYLLPMTDLINAVSLEKMTTGHSFYKNAFLMSGEILHTKHEEFRTILHYLAIATLVATITMLFSNRKPTSETLFFGAVSLFSLFMMYPPSQFLWDFLPLLQRIQFPWRFFIVISFSLFFLETSHNRMIKPLFTRYSKALYLVILGSLAVITIYFAYLEATQQISSANKTTITKSERIKVGAIEYLPIYSPERIYEQVANRTLASVKEHLIGKEAHIDYAVTFSGHQILASIETPKSQDIILQQYYFPTWQASDVNESKLLDVTRAPNGMIGFTLPKGRHKISFSHKKTPNEKASNIISIFSLGIVLLQITFHFSQRKYSKNNVK